MSDEPTSGALYRAARAFEVHPGRIVLAAFVGAVTFFFLGFAFVKGLEDARGLELVPRGTYIPTTETVGYLKPEDVETNYVHKIVVARDYTANAAMARDYISRERCQSGAALSHSPEQSAAAPTGVSQAGAAIGPQQQSSVAPPSNPKPASQPSAQYVQGFEVTRPECAWYAGRVNCSFRITNTEGRSRYIQVIMDGGSSARSYLVDNSGQRYYANAMMFAGDGPGFERFVGEHLESGVPTAAAMGFDAPEKPAGSVVLVLFLGIVNPRPIVFRDLQIGS